MLLFKVVQTMKTDNWMQISFVEAAGSTSEICFENKYNHLSPVKTHHFLIMFKASSTYIWSWEVTVDVQVLQK